MLLKDKVALVTGGGRGLGRDHALALAKAGAKVIVNDLGGTTTGEGRDEGPAQSVVDEIIASGGVAQADTRSIADWQQAHDIVNDTVRQYGRLDILVNNAGINRAGPIGNFNEDDWDLSFAVNMKGVVATMNAAAIHWREAGPSSGRAIINTASPAAVHPIPMLAIYSATKAGVIAYSQSAAQELADFGVRVNCIAPMARTRIIEDAPPDIAAMLAPREGFDPFLPEHVSQLVVFLASGMNNFTGKVFGVGGDNVYLFKEWSAEFHANNNEVKWAPETLGRSLGDFPIQEERWILLPTTERLNAAFPSDEMLEALEKVEH